MFVGHLALGLAAKRRVPEVGLGWLVAAVTATDLLWPLLLLAGVETVRIAPGATAFTPFVFTSYPWSHSLLMDVVWGAGLAALAHWRGLSVKAAVLIGALVVSHWVLDFFSHAPDMPLWPGPSPHLGLGLWHSILWTYVVEGSLWIGGIAIYLRVRPLAGWRSRLAFWSFVGVTTTIWAVGPWGPPPPNVTALAWFGLLGWLAVAWAAWADRRPATV